MMHFIDYVIVILVLLISTAIGLYTRFSGDKQKTINEYLLGNKQMSSWKIGISLMATCTSTITLLGTSSENYSFGLQYIAIIVGYIIFTPIVAYLFVPVFCNLKTSSSFEYLEHRFGKRSRFLASLCCVIQYLLYLGVALYGPVIALGSLIEFQTEYILILLGTICIFYSTIGGLKAVILTDIFQSLLMFLAVLSIIICTSIELGGLQKIFDIAKSGERLNFFNYNLDLHTRYTFWNLVIGGGTVFLSVYAVGPSFVQKYLSTKNVQSAQRAVWMNLPVLIIIVVISSFSGIAMYATFYQCDPVLNENIQKHDQLMSYYVLEKFSQYPGLTGLFVAGIFSASLSTLSSIMNSLAAVILEDYVKPTYNKCRKKDLSANQSLVVTKLLVLILGLISILLGFWAKKFQSILQLSLTIFSLLGGPLLGIFSLGIFTTIANDEGSCLGFILGLITSFLLSLKSADGTEKLPLTTIGCENVQGLFNSTTESIISQIDSNQLNSNDSFSISFMWLCPLATLFTFFSGLLFSKLIDMLFIRGNNRKSINTNLLCPPLAKFLQKRTNKSLTTHGNQEQDQTTEFNLI